MFSDARGVYTPLQQTPPKERRPSRSSKHSIKQAKKEAALDYIRRKSVASLKLNTRERTRKPHHNEVLPSNIHTSSPVSVYHAPAPAPFTAAEEDALAQVYRSSNGYTHEISETPCYQGVATCIQTVVLTRSHAQTLWGLRLRLCSSGLVVDEVVAGGAAVGSVRVGDVVTHINHEAVGESADEADTDCYHNNHGHIYVGHTPNGVKSLLSSSDLRVCLIIMRGSSDATTAQPMSHPTAHHATQPTRCIPGNTVDSAAAHADNNTSPRLVRFSGNSDLSKNGGSCPRQCMSTRVLFNPCFEY